MLKLDATDRRILERLQANAKINIKALCDELNLTKTPIYERIRRYEKEGIIQKQVTILNPDKIGPHMVVFCSVSLESQKLKAIQQFSRDIENIPEVLECYLLGGTNDFLLKVVVKDLNAYHHFSSGKLAALPNVRVIKSAFVLNQIKHSTVIPLADNDAP